MPQGWVIMQGRGQVRFQRPPGADTVKLACILRRRELHSDLKSDFLANELDPNGVRAQRRFYVAGGSRDALEHLAVEAGKAGWVVRPLARADDGTGFLPFQSAQAMTARQASSFALRLTRHELGQLTFGPAPSRDGPDFDVK